MSQHVKPSDPIITPTETVTFTIDGQSVTVPKGTTVLEAALRSGISIPTFCWHPKLKPVGACRMCYVEIERMNKLQVSCATEAGNGMVVHTKSNQVLQGRKAVLEFTLTNHPLDCPTCDKGGECDLQNLTFEHGYDDSRFEFSKRRKTMGITDENRTTFDDLRIGPEIVLNRNRCILCYKCVRANKEAFGEYDLGAYERGNITEINSAPGQQVDNPFSGNLVEICPVGALTNSDWRYKIRVWLTKTTPSICNFTSSGVNTLFYKEDHKNKMYRTTSRRNDAIDDGWISDVSRYGYQIVNSEERLKTPLVKRNGKQVAVSWDEAIAVIKEKLSAIQDRKGSVCLAGLASPSLDNASLHTFNKFCRTVLETNNVDFRTDYKSLPEKSGSAFESLCNQPFSIADIDRSDVIVVFGSDLTREHHNEYLRIRKAANFVHPRIYFMNPYRTKAADVADSEIVYNQGCDEAIITGICHAAIEENLVDGSLASKFTHIAGGQSLAQCAKAAGVDENDLRYVARALSSGKKITFIAGELLTRSIAREQIASSLTNLSRLFQLQSKGQIAVLARHANSVGAGKLGLMPTLSSEQTATLKAEWGTLPTASGLTTDQIFTQAAKGEVAGLLVFGANPMKLYPDKAFAKAALEKLEFLVVADLFETETTAFADVVLPISSWAEYTGDYVNLEGKSQTARAAIRPIEGTVPAFAIIDRIAEAFGRKLFASDSQRTNEMTALLSLKSSEMPSEFASVPFPSPNGNGGLALMVVDDSHHCGHITEKSPSLSAFCGETYAEISPETAKASGVSDGDAVRLENEFGRIVVRARISEQIRNSVVVVPCNFMACPVTSLQSHKARVDRVKLTRVSE
ncbi:MAG: NADH-quinone oxidoreductase subunit NuoG [Candidatus Zixiibacteriota bacterium]